MKIKNFWNKKTQKYLPHTLFLSIFVLVLIISKYRFSDKLSQLSQPETTSPNSKIIPKENQSVFPKEGKTLEALRQLEPDKLSADKPTREVDINLDNLVDLQIEAYNNDIREGYYYLIQSASANNTYHRLIWNGASLALGDKIYFIDQFIIDTKRDGINAGKPLYEIDSHLYAAGEGEFSTDIQLVWTFQPKRIENPSDQQEIMSYVSWLQKLGVDFAQENPSNSPQPTPKNISLKEARTIILKEGIISGFVPHEPGDTSFSTFSGSYKVLHDPNDDFWGVVEECSEKCKYASIALE